MGLGYKSIHTIGVYNFDVGWNSLTLKLEVVFLQGMDDVSSTMCNYVFLRPLNDPDSAV